MGFGVLDLSKYFVYDSHYNYNKKIDAKLLFTDTERLTYEIKTDDVYQDFFQEKNSFDFSNYPKDSKFYDPSSMNKIDKMKNESKGRTNDEFPGIINGKENKKRKWINSVVVKNIKHKKYLDILFNKKVVRHVMKIIQIELHKTGIYDVFGISLSCFNNKRNILDDAIDRLSYFHKDRRSQ